MRNRENRGTGTRENRYTGKQDGNLAMREMQSWIWLRISGGISTLPNYHAGEAWRDSLEHVPLHKTGDVQA